MFKNKTRRECFNSEESEALKIFILFLSTITVACQVDWVARSGDCRYYALFFVLEFEGWVFCIILQLLLFSYSVLHNIQFWVHRIAEFILLYLQLIFMHSGNFKIYNCFNNSRCWIIYQFYFKFWSYKKRICFIVIYFIFLYLFTKNFICRSTPIFTFIPIFL